MLARFMQASAVFAAAAAFCVPVQHGLAAATPVELVIPSPDPSSGDVEPQEPVLTSVALPPLVQTTITLDGKRINITLSLHAIPTRIWTLGPGPSRTTIQVSLDTADGDVFPGPVAATRIRLQRVASPNRIYRPELTELVSIPENIGHADFSADNAPRLVEGTRFRAAVRIEYNGRVISVPMGVVRVQPASLTFTPGV